MASRVWLLALGAVALGACAEEFRDPACHDGLSGIDDRLPTILSVYLFHEDGAPYCGSAIVEARQGDGPRLPFSRDPSLTFIVGDGGLLYGQPSNGCNHYWSGGSTEPGGIVRPCAAPLHWSVAAEGCTMIGGTRGYDDGYLEGQGDRGFSFRVRLRCDAGVLGDASRSD